MKSYNFLFCFLLTLALIFSFTQSTTKNLSDFEISLKSTGVPSTCMLLALDTLRKCEGANTHDIFTDIRTRLNTIQKGIENNSERLSALIEGRIILRHPLEPSQNCKDLFDIGDKNSGVRIVYPFNCCRNQSLTVFCDQTTDEGGWTVIQRRDNIFPRENFYRSWKEYQNGFGNITGEFWLGLEAIHNLVNSTEMELRIDLEDFEGKKAWAKYSKVFIENSENNYRLYVMGYSGDAGDALEYQNGMMFSTKDSDNDMWVGEFGDNCANEKRGGWWYNNCAESNLNGHPYTSKEEAFSDGIIWTHFRGWKYSLKKTSMKVRPRL